MIKVFKLTSDTYYNTESNLFQIDMEFINEDENGTEYMEEGFLHFETEYAASLVHKHMRQNLIIGEADLLRIQEQAAKGVEH